MKTEKTKSRASDSAGAFAPGTQATDFRLPTTPDQFVSLSDFHGAPIVLVFYPAEWSPVGNDQVVLYDELLPEFCDDQASFLGMSVDGVWCHLAFARDWKLRFHRAGRL